jgi:hypothetical protein
LNIEVAPGVMPVHVAIHLVLGEQQRLEGREALLVERERRMPVSRGGHGQRREQPVHVDHPVGHAAHPGVAGQIVELVHVDRARHQTAQRLACPALNQREQCVCRSAQLRQPPCELTIRQVPRRQLFVVRQAGFFERVGEGIVPDVV